MIRNWQLAGELVAHEAIEYAASYFQFLEFAEREKLHTDVFWNCYDRTPLDFNWTVST
jgi:hypothetical protein